MGCLELQASLSGSLGDRPHATVVQEAAAVEHDRLDSLAQQAFRDRSADSLCPGLVTPARSSFKRSLHRRFHAGGRHERPPGHVVDHLHEMWTRLRKTAILGLSDVPLVR